MNLSATGSNRVACVFAGVPAAACQNSCFLTRPPTAQSFLARSHARAHPQDGFLGPPESGGGRIPIAMNGNTMFVPIWLAVYNLAIPSPSGASQCS